MYREELHFCVYKRNVGKYTNRCIINAFSSNIKCLSIREISFSSFSCSLQNIIKVFCKQSVKLLARNSKRSSHQLVTHKKIIFKLRTLCKLYDQNLPIKLGSLAVICQVDEGLFRISRNIIVDTEQDKKCGFLKQQIQVILQQKYF